MKRLLLKAISKFCTNKKKLFKEKNLHRWLLRLNTPVNVSRLLYFIKFVNSFENYMIGHLALRDQPAPLFSDCFTDLLKKKASLINVELHRKIFCMWMKKETKISVICFVRNVYKRLSLKFTPFVFGFKG